MSTIVLFITLVFIEFVFRPRFDTTKDKNLILWYNSYDTYGNKRTFVHVKKLK